MYCPVFRCHQTSGSVTLRAAMAKSPMDSAARKTFLVRRRFFTVAWIIPRQGRRYNPELEEEDKGINAPKQTQDVDRCADRRHAVNSRRALLEGESPGSAGLPGLYDFLYGGEDVARGSGTQAVRRRFAV